MKRTLRAEELKLWAAVAATIRPAPGVVRPVAPAEPAAATAESKPVRHAPSTPVRVAKRATPPPPERIEPNRRRRIARERDPIDARVDLHGMDFDRAKAVLHGFIRRSVADGHRAVLVITGKGYEGFGVLRQWTPVWLADPAVRGFVAGVSQAERRHGGDGALYVALKLRT